MLVKLQRGLITVMLTDVNKKGFQEICGKYSEHLKFDICDRFAHIYSIDVNDYLFEFLRELSEIFKIILI